MTRAWHALALAVALTSGLWLSGCGGGGGGGDDDGGGGTPSYNLSGTIAIAETAAVDSDTNDVNQSGFVPNDTVGTAQALSAPVLLVGSVNEPNTGPRGNNNNGSATLGDADDYFRVDLVAGQVVELEFATDPAASDVDLYIFSPGGSIVGASDGVDSRFECVTIATSGTYVVNVYAFRNASIYNLRIGAPGTAAGCVNSTAATPFVPGELVAEPLRSHAAAGERAQALMRAAGVRTGSAAAEALQTGIGAQLLRLPADALSRSDGLAALARVAGDKSALARTLGPADLARRAKEAAHPPPESVQTLRYAKRLRASGAFQYVEPNRVLHTTAITGAFPPNDRHYSYQRWHYEQIDLPAAMERITALGLPATQPRPLVAVIDDGVVLDHPDLAPQLFSSGRAFVAATAGDGDRASGDNLATAADRPVFHGTHVAGTVGASTYDGIGGAGTAPMALVLPLRVFGATGGARSIDIVQAMRYAAGLSNRSGTVPARRADVINLSLGGDGACDGAFATAVADARAAGTIVVAAAGNSGRNATGQRAAVGTPANCPGAIAVSATDARRNLTNYSNTGAALVVAAPGGDTSASTTGNGAPDGVYSDLATFDDAGRRQPAFGAMQGTSMASPHVAGVMALMRYVNPALTVTQVDSLFAAGSLTDDLGTAGRDIDYGFGLVNARKAVEAALAAAGSPPAPPPAQISALPSSVDFGALQTSAAVELRAPGTSTETVVGAPAVDLPGGAAAGAVTVAATAVDAGGLGRYTIAVNRSAFSGTGTFYPSVRFALSSGRTITVQLALHKPAAGGGASRADFGPVYVLLIDPDAGTVEHTVLATLANGRYSWSHAGYAKPRVSIVAGGDLDNDDFICARGEPCGAFPVLPPGDDLLVIELSGHRSDLNFQVSPLSGMSPAATGAAAGTVPRGVWRRQPTWPVPEMAVGDLR